MATYDLLVLLLLAPALWWLMAMVRAVIGVRSRALRGVEETLTQQR
jgi:hypothetical protein